MWWLLIVVAGVILLVVLLSFVTYRIVFFSPHKGQNDAFRLTPEADSLPQNGEMKKLIEELIARPSENVITVAFDGVVLFARYFHTADDAPLAICFHGYRGVAERDFCCGGKFLLEEGHNVLLVDQRAHKNSSGHTIAFGEVERNDVLSWVNFALQKFGADVRIVLYGVSMGAATVLMAADLPLPQNVKGIVADCPYDSPANIIKSVCKQQKLPVPLVYPFIWLGALLFGHFVLGKHSAQQSVTNCNIPILLIHGEADGFVPCAMSKNIFEANRKISFHTFPNAQHGLSYLADTQRYEKLCREFLANCLSNTPQEASQPNNDN